MAVCANEISCSSNLTPISEAKLTTALLVSSYVSFPEDCSGSPSILMLSRRLYVCRISVSDSAFSSIFRRSKLLCSSSSALRS